MGTKKITGALEVSGDLSVSGSNVSFNNQNLSFNVANLDVPGSLTTRTTAYGSTTINLNNAIVGVSGGVGEKSDFEVSNQNILSKRYNTIKSTETWTEIALSSIPAAYLALIRKFIPSLSIDNLTKCEYIQYPSGVGGNDTNPLIDETNDSIAQQIGKYYETDSDDYDWTYTIFTNGNLYYLHGINIDTSFVLRLTYNYTASGGGNGSVTPTDIELNIQRWTFKINNDPDTDDIIIFTCYTEEELEASISNTNDAIDKINTTYSLNLQHISDFNELNTTIATALSVNPALANALYSEFILRCIAFGAERAMDRLIQMSFGHYFTLSSISSVVPTIEDDNIIGLDIIYSIYNAQLQETKLAKTGIDISSLSTTSTFTTFTKLKGEGVAAGSGSGAGLPPVTDAPPEFVLALDENLEPKRRQDGFVAITLNTKYTRTQTDPDDHAIIKFKLLASLIPAFVTAFNNGVDSVNNAIDAYNTGETHIAYASSLADINDRIYSISQLSIFVGLGETLAASLVNGLVEIATGEEISFYDGMSQVTVISSLVALNEAYYTGTYEIGMYRSPMSDYVVTLANLAASMDGSAYSSDSRDFFDFDYYY